MTVKIQGKSSQCEFRGLGSACSTGTTRCSFELNPEEVGLMVNELFKPWQSLTLSCLFFFYLISFSYLLTIFYLRFDSFNQPDRSGFGLSFAPHAHRRRTRVIAHPEHPQTSVGL